MAYQGLSIRYPFGVEGLIGDPDTESIGSLTRAENIRFFGQRLIRDDGLQILHDEVEGSGRITGLATSRLFGDDGLLICRGQWITGPTFFYNINTELPEGTGASFVEAGNEDEGQPPKVFIFGPNFIPRVIKSEEPQPMDLIPLEWRDSPPSTGFVHKSRMCFVSGHRVYYSDPSSHEELFAEVKKIEIKKIETKRIQNEQYPQRYEVVHYGDELYDTNEAESYDPPRYTDCEYGEDCYDVAESYDPPKYEDCEYDDECYADAISDDPKRYSFIRSAGVITIYPGEGDGIIAAASFRSLAIVWKYPRGIYVLNTAAIDTIGWSVNKISEDLGCVSYRSLVAINNDIIFMDASGDIHRLSAVEETGDVNASNLTFENDMTEWVKNNMDLRRIDEVRMAYDSVNSEANIVYPHQDGNNYRLIIDFSNQRGPRFRENRMENCSEVYEYRETASVRRMLVGTVDGKVKRVFRQTNPGGVDAIDSRSIIETPWFSFDFFDPQLNFIRKTIDTMDIEISYIGRLRMLITVETGFSKRTSFTINANYGFFLDISRLDIDIITNLISSTTQFSKRVGLSGNQFRIKVEDNGSSDFEFVNVQFLLRPSDNRTINVGIVDG